MTTSPTIVLVVVGDIMIGRSFNSLFHEHPGATVWGDTKRVLDTGHLVLANLETTLSEGKSKDKIPNKPGGFYYHLRPEYAGVLRDAGIDYVSLANNHILDYKTSGLRETIKTLDTIGISHSGAGLTLTDARRPAIFKIRTIPSGGPVERNRIAARNRIATIGRNRIAIFSAADHYLDWAATSANSVGAKSTAGTWIIHHSDPNAALRFFEKYRKRHPKTFIILSYHWGANYEPDVPNWKRELATKLFQSGVDLILGHSPHHIEPHEVIDGKYVFYSLGDFIDDYAIDVDYRNDIGMIGRLTIDLGSGSVVGLEKYMTRIQDLHVNLL